MFASCQQLFLSRRRAEGEGVERGWECYLCHQKRGSISLSLIPTIPCLKSLAGCQAYSKNSVYGDYCNDDLSNLSR